MILSFLIISCDELNKVIDPQSDAYLIDKTVSTATSEQVIESGNDFKMIFPPQSLSSDIEIKVKKESSYPVFNISNTTLGNNVYRIKFKGNTSFLIPVRIIINYDKSKIPSGKTAAESVKGYVYAKGNWKLVDFQLDEANSKIIFIVSDLSSPKTGKNSPILLENEGEIIIGNGVYSPTDSGQNDFLLAKYKYLNVNISSGIVWDIEPNNGVSQYGTYNSGETDRPETVWNGNSFSVKIVKEHLGDIVIVEIKGEADQIGTDKEDGFVTIKKFNFIVSESSTVSFLSREFSCVAENLRLEIPKLPDYQTCFILLNGNEIGNFITDLKKHIHSEKTDTLGNVTAWESNSVSYFFRDGIDQLFIEFAPWK
jgi:hypothetical protein